MSKPPSLESLLTAFDKTESLRADTEALKPRLEGEINQALASGDALDEKLAAGLQTKRGQLELIIPKLAQISARADELVAAIKPAFEARYIAFTCELQSLQYAVTNRVVTLFKELGLEPNVAEELTLQGIWVRTKLATELGELDSRVKFPVSLGNIIGAAKELLKSEAELGKLKARPEISAMVETFGQKL